MAHTEAKNISLYLESPVYVKTVYEYVPIRWVLVQLSKLPVHWVDVHVVVLFKVLCKELDRVVTCMEASLTLEDFLHLENTKDHALAGFYPFNIEYWFKSIYMCIFEQ